MRKKGFESQGIRGVVDVPSNTKKIWTIELDFLLHI